VKEKNNQGITLVALVVTIVVLLILAGITIVYVFGDNGVFSKASKAKQETAIAVAREKLELVLGTDAKVEKHTNPIYNQDEFLDALILEKIKDSEIMGDIAIVDGYAFSLDRSVPKIGEYIGKKEDLVFPKLEASTQLAEDNKSATITITALEEENGINKIEIWQKGEKLDEFPYEDIKTTITKEYVVNQNGNYTIKAYGDLVANKIVEVTGLLTSVKFEPNGSAEYKKSHSAVVKIEETGDKIVKAKYQWINSVTTPEDSEFPDNQTFQSGDTITKAEVTGRYYLWVMLEFESGEKVKWRSEEFYFDNEAPNITALTVAKYSETGITLNVTAQDNEAGIVKFEFYVDGERKEDYTQTITETTESVTKTVTITGLTTGSHNCEVRVYDVAGNNNTRNESGTTKLYAWDTYEVLKKGYSTNPLTTYDYDFVPSYTYTLYSRYSFSESEGFVGGGTTKSWDGNPNSAYEGWYYILNKTTVYYLDEGLNFSNSAYKVRCKKYTATYRSSDAKGTSRNKVVYADERSTYPDNGTDSNRSIWYVYKGIY